MPILNIYIYEYMNIRMLSLLQPPPPLEQVGSGGGLTVLERPREDPF